MVRKMGRLATITAAITLLLGTTLSARAGSCPNDLPRTLGYWKTHADAWPSEMVAVGDNELGRDYAIFNVLQAPSEGDAVLILLHQLIPAKLNIAAGADGSAVEQYIEDADELLEDYWIGDNDLDEVTRTAIIELAERLDEFNNGAYCTLPVELTAFEATADGSSITLSWSTATETNNALFEIEHRRGDGYGFERVATVDGRGTTSTEQDYSLRIGDLGYGHHTFRLKQVDLDGTFSYSAAVEVESNLTSSFALAETYPNPFNPSTTIRFALREAGAVTLGVYDLTGRLVRTLASGGFEAGSHDVTFKADNLPSGTYLYRLQTSAGAVTGSMILLK